MKTKIVVTKADINILKNIKLIVSFLIVNLSIYLIPPIVQAADYYPLNVGNYWIYYPSYGDGYRVDAIVGKDNIDGISTYKWMRRESAPDNYHEKRWYAKDGSDLMMYKFDSNEGCSSPLLLEPSVLVYKLDPTVGDNWQMQLNCNDDDINFKTLLYVESISDTIEVNSVNFNNCIRIRQIDEITQEGTTEYKYKKIWLAPDVGPVLYKSYVDGSWSQVKMSQELVKYKLKK